MLLTRNNFCSMCAHDSWLLQKKSHAEAYAELEKAVQDGMLKSIGLCGICYLELPMRHFFIVLVIWMCDLDR